MTLRARPRTSSLAQVSRPENIAIVGMPGNGKSYAARAWLRGDPRLIYVDPTDSARGVGGTEDNEDWTHVARRVETVLAIMRTRMRFRVSFGVGQIDAAERRQAIGRILTEALNNPPGRAYNTIALDEMKVICPNGEDIPDLTKALVLGRHRNCRILLASQRTVHMPPDWRALCEDFAIFRQYEQIDMDRLDKIRKGLGRDAAELEPYKFWRWRLGALTGPEGPVRR